MEKKVTSSGVMGLLVALVLIVLSLTLYFTDLYTESWSQYLGLALLLAGIIFAVLNHSKEKEHAVTFGSLFSFGFKVTAAVTCLVVLYAWLSGYLFPDIKTRILEMSRIEAMKRPGVSEADVNRGMEWFEKNFTLFMILNILFWYLVIGAIASLIAAAVAKKRPVADFDKI